MTLAFKTARLAAALIALATTPAAAMTPQVAPAQAPAGQQRPAGERYETLLENESRSRELCESNAERVFVRYRDGTECVTYISTTGRPRTVATVLFFQGDVQPERFEELKTQDAARTFVRSAQGIANRFDVRIIFVSRPGTFGTSGNHGRRRTEYEMLVMNAAVDAIKARLGLGSLVLVGQSGGSTVSAALIALGRTDVSCAVLGSGGQNVTGNFRRRNPTSRATDAQIQRALFDPTARIPAVRPDPNRRVLVLGDPTDTVTHYDLQIVYAQRLRDAGHRAIAFKIRGAGDMMHGAVDQAIPAAAMCARGDSDAAIFQATAANPRAPLDVGPNRPAAPTPATPAPLPPIATRPAPAPVPPVAALPQRPVSQAPSLPPQSPPVAEQPPAARIAPVAPAPVPETPVAAVPPARPRQIAQAPPPIVLPPLEAPRVAALAPPRTAAPAPTPAPPRIAAPQPLPPTPVAAPEAPRAPLWHQQPGGLLRNFPS